MRSTRTGGSVFVDVVFAVGVLLVIASTVRAIEPTFPGKRWRKVAPQDAGLDPQKLDTFAKAIGGHGIVIRHGRVVKAWGNPAARADWASAGKPVITTMLFFAVQERKLPSVNALVRPWVKKRWPGKDLLPKDRTMTFRHLADMTSGYARAEKPGTHWAYNDYAICLYGNVLSEVFGESLNAVAMKRLRALEFEDGGIFGSRRGLGVNASARDFARIGLLWMHRGKWKNRQILKKEFFDRYMKVDVQESLPRTKAGGKDTLGIGTYGGGSDQTDFGPGVYGFNWWFNPTLSGRKTRFMQHLPADAFQTNGHWGREVMLVIPSLDLIAAARGNWGGTKLRAAKLLVEAVQRAPRRASPPIALQAAVGRRNLGRVGTFAKWTKIEIRLTGLRSKGRGTPNPFDIPVDVTFKDPSGKTYTVPGFYDGNGRGGLDGSVWKVRFSADETGHWTFTSKSPNAGLDKVSGSFTVTQPPANAPELYRWGRLESVGTAKNRIRYLKFRDGPYWLKAGCDDPENFLGTAFKNYDTVGERKVAIDYLAARGINSMYIMTNTLAGDHRDVWPWLGDTEAEGKKNSVKGKVRFDLTRLEMWRQVFEYMHKKGLVVYIILDDDSCWTGYDHERTYREIVARFGYLPALLFNISEEANERYKLEQSLDYARLLRQIDPYDHPIGIHNVNDPTSRSQAYVQADFIDFSAIQTSGKDPLRHNAQAIRWIDACVKLKTRVVMVNFDEGRPELDRRAWWSAYMGGGVWEAHTLEPYDSPMSQWAKTWKELGGTRRFMETLPFWEMTPNNALIRVGKAFCLAKPGEAYALYLPEGGAVSVSLQAGRRYRFDWWNPANGWNGKFRRGGDVAGGVRKFTAPAAGDWTLRILKR